MLTVCTLHDCHSTAIIVMTRADLAFPEIVCLKTLSRDTRHKDSPYTPSSALISAGDHARAYDA